MENERQKAILLQRSAITYSLSTALHSYNNPIAKPIGQRWLSAHEISQALQGVGHGVSGTDVQVLGWAKNHDLVEIILKRIEITGICINLGRMPDVVNCYVQSVFTSATIFACF